ncbi:hypothetical protein SVIOM342S_04217 [Streptomyces violaceorubidus]
MDLALARDPVSSNTLAGVELPAREIAARMLEFDRIVAVRAAGAHSLTDPREAAKTSTLRRHFHEYGTTHVNGARITVYVRDHDPAPGATVRRRCARPRGTRPHRLPGVRPVTATRHRGLAGHEPHTGHAPLTRPGAARPTGTGVVAGLATAAGLLLGRKVATTAATSPTASRS